MESFLLHIASVIAIYAILAGSLNVVMGYTGLLHLGHVAFFGVGAYTYAIATMSFGLPTELAMLLATLFPMLLSPLLVWATAKLQGDYFALATLGFAFVAYTVFEQWFDVTNGPLGIVMKDTPSFFGFQFTGNELLFFLFALLWAVIAYGAMYRLMNSPYGKLLEATRDEERGAQMYGKNTWKLKTQAMMFASALAGLAGSLLVMYLRVVEPSTFFLNDIILVLVIVIVGGLGSLRGSVLGTLLIFAINEGMRFVSFYGLAAMAPEGPLQDVLTSVATVWSQNVGSLRIVLYSLLLLVILLWRPKGILGRVSLDTAS